MTMLQQADRRPAGYLTLIDNETGRVLMETGLRQCSHCQYTWIHCPGSGILRGFCFRCNGHTCGRRACMDCYPKEQQIEDIEAVALQNKRSIEAAIRRHNLRESIFTHPGRHR